MKKNILFNLLAFILIFNITACSQQEESPQPVQQKTVQKKKISKEERIKIRAQRKEENNKLFEIAKSGKDENVKYVRLSRENNFTDQLSEKHLFTRDATSGPGTGKFTGEGFEFAEGKCDDLNNLSDTDKKKTRWRKRIDKCQSSIIESDWCARLKDDPSVSYNLTFLSWPIGNDGECAGACKEHDYKTAYVRVKSK